MARLRRMLAQVGVACVLCQVGAVVLPPALLWASEMSDCTCMTDGHAMCPMHRPSRTGCAMRAAADDGTAMLAPLAIVAVVLPLSQAAIAAPPRTSINRSHTVAISARGGGPDSPPPRS